MSLLEFSVNCKKHRLIPLTGINFRFYAIMLNTLHEEDVNNRQPTTIFTS